MLFRSRRWWGCLRAGGRRLRRGTGPGFQCSSGHFNAAWHHPPMSAIHEPLPSLHRVPRASSAWIWVLLAAHLAVVLAWWQLGWRVGLLLLVAVHLAFLWGALRPRSAMYGPVLSHLPVTDRRVWLTIDDGPSDDTPALLDLLEAHGAKATFFLVGERAAARPDLVRGIAARGHGIGKHSHGHPQAWFWALGPARGGGLRLATPLATTRRGCSTCSKRTGRRRRSSWSARAPPRARTWCAGSRRADTASATTDTAIRRPGSGRWGRRGCGARSYSARRCCARSPAARRAGSGPSSAMRIPSFRRRCAPADWRALPGTRARSTQFARIHPQSSPGWSANSTPAPSGSRHYAPRPAP